ncbi:GntR family transcriptional regulator [Halioxenophilus sp. WMMB6]|uniref:GntR family transcriptional regulator n=1 Tax=Halioxenophilus sp. WMMB6 TaxID=3073815 RepID=UPI00295E4847|nr:GntR family transcriptional regulator [Halioxenophilus sp. WMMB6]
MARASVIALLKKRSKQQGVITEGPTPLYYQLYSLMKEQIVDGTISYGAQLPTEQELGDAFGLSRITVKRAMDELASEKLVERRRGRGTSVTYKYKPKPVKAPLVGMLESIETMGRHTVSNILDIAELPPPAEIREELGLANEETACRMLRVRLTEDEKVPFAYYISWTLAPKKLFSEAALKQHTRVELLRKSGVYLSKIDQLLSAEPAKAEVARELNMREGDPLLVLVRRSYDTAGKLIDILHGSYNPAIFQYQMTMSLDEEKPEAAEE